MDKTKLIASVVAEIQNAGYLGELIKSVLKVGIDLGFLSRNSELIKLATALEILLQSELFTIILTRILSGVGPKNEPGQVPASWAGNLNNPSTSTATRPADINRGAL